jgi:hypothetical protein
MKNLIAALAVSMSLVDPMAFADGAKCDCSDKCMRQCQKGDSKACKCKACDCAKSGQCSKEKCGGKTDAKLEQK